MPEELSIDRLIEDGYTFEVGRLPDTPLAEADQLIYTDLRTGHVLVARAPISG